jgi:phage terminase large subunit GpA-like protein
MYSPPSFVNPGELVAAALHAYIPPTSVATSAYAAEHRWLNNPGSYIGKWRNQEMPFLVEPMDMLDSPEHLAVAIVGPARSGKTSVAENWLLKSVCADPADFLWYLATDDLLRSYVKQVINPMLDLHEGMKSRLGPNPVDDSIGFKRFRGMTAQFLTAAYNNFISKTATRIVLDEIDAYPVDLGDPYSLADIRRQTAGFSSMIAVLSHPDQANGLEDKHWSRGIMALYGRSDRRTWYWPCPHCNGYSSPCPGAARAMTLHYNADAPLDEIEASAALLCPICGATIADNHRRAMNLEGKWVAAAQEINEDGEVIGSPASTSIAGYWITGFMSPMVIGGIGALARAYEEARINAARTGDLKPLKDVVVKRWGIPYDPPRRQGSMDAATLADRASPALTLGQVPTGVRFLTAWVDQQSNRFESLVRGWGANGESWVVAYDVHQAEPFTNPHHWDELFRRMRDARYPLADGSGRAMRLRAWGVDVHGGPGATSQAYEAWRRAKRRAEPRLLGRFEGREGWSIIPTRGNPSRHAPLLQVTWPDSGRKDRMARAGGTVPVAQFGANAWKDVLAAQLAVSDGPGCIHFPAALLAAQPPHPFFEGLVSETRDEKTGAWTHKSTARNEPLDLMVGTHVVAHLHGLARINWTSPPAWADDWERNSLVDLPPPRVALPPDAAAPRALPSPEAPDSFEARLAARLAEKPAMPAPVATDSFAARLAARLAEQRARRDH